MLTSFAGCDHFVQVQARGLLHSRMLSQNIPEVIFNSCYILLVLIVSEEYADLYYVCVKADHGGCIIHCLNCTVIIFLGQSLCSLVLLSCSRCVQFLAR